MNNYFVVLIISVAVIIGVFSLRKLTRVRENEFIKLSETIGFKIISTKYASGLAGEVKGKHALILSSVKDASTIHIATSRMQLYLETDWPGDIETKDIEESLLKSVPKGMELRSGKSIFNGSSLDLVIKEAYGKKWNNLYLVATPTDTTPKSIIERFNKMSEFS